MEFYILDSERKLVAVVDHFLSAIWTPRYDDVGDFELQLPPSLEVFKTMKEDYFVTRLDDDMVGVIERIVLVTDEESGNYILVTGRCAKSLLDRRIVWNQTTLSGTVEDCVRQLITENVVSPSDPKRAMSGFVLSDRKGFTWTMGMQVTGDNLLEVVTKICKTYGYGFSVNLVNGVFVFDLFKGVDRSLQQEITPHVEFSPDFDNIITLEYSKEKTEFKNVALVAGEGEGTDRKTASVGYASGINRRELYVDARDISTNNGTIDDVTYTALLSERGSEKLTEHAIKTEFNGQVEPSTNYDYKVDYFLGDIVQITNEYGITITSRITEVIECEDANGYSITPTFEEISVDELILIEGDSNSLYFVETEDGEIIYIDNIVESENNMKNNSLLLSITT